MHTSRRSGILVPLFSLASSSGWGVGEFRDLAVFARWAARAGQSFIQILPLTETPELETSPYSALTAMALDPIYIALDDLEDFEALGGESMLAATDGEALAACRAAPRVQHRRIRALKGRALRRAHARFLQDEVARATARASRYHAFGRAEAWWLDDYALFQALRGRYAGRAWWEWPRPLGRRRPRAIEQARARLGAEIAFRKYVQWIAAEQWEAARAAAAPVAVFGDVPFMIAADSPDVWAQQHEFRFDATVGVPPDAFSDTGQDWGLPPWRADVMAENNFDWMRRRARRSAALFDGFRLDHLVGLYRLYLRPLDLAAAPSFTPPDEPSQLALGERLVRLYQETGAEVIAEDLGTVPDFVRASLDRMGVPGFKVLRWERRWSDPGQPYIDPAEYPELSVATTGTHDTEPLAGWWDTLDRDERADVLAIPTVARTLSKGDTGSNSMETFTPPLNEAIVRALLAAPSRLAIFPIQDIFGWRDRINTPARVDEQNWTWRLPWLVDRMDGDVPTRRAAELQTWSSDAERR